MFIRKSTIWKYVLAALAGAVLYCEWFVYIIQPYYWQGLECQAHNGTCTKILFVADPQIQGEQAVPPPLSYLFNWDSDWYLKSTFSVVLKHFRPDVIILMGDLMDEGSISTSAEYYRYVERLANIIVLTYPVQLVWLPGDNDIGGESEPIRKDKIEEFDKYFNQPSVITFRNISIYKVNAITHTIPQVPASEDKNLKIAVSHYPVTIRHVFGLKVNDVIHPNIYFCAHEHSSKYVKQNKDFTQRQMYPYEYGEKVLDIPFDEKTLYEIYVPTCSYRMGTSKIGYGAAVLENNNQQMRYTVFWSSQRFPYLFFYLGVVIFLTIYFLVFCSGRLFYRRPKILAPRTDTQPLLDRI